MKRLLFSAFVALSCAWSASAQISPDSVAGLGIVHRYFYEWGKVGPVDITSITVTYQSDTVRFLRLSWIGIGPNSTHSVVLDCNEVRQYAAAVEQMKAIQATTPELGHEYSFKSDGDSGLDITIFAINNLGGGVSWQIRIDNTSDYIPNTANYIRSAGALQSLGNYFRDFLLNCR